MQHSPGTRKVQPITTKYPQHVHVTVDQGVGLFMLDVLDADTEAKWLPNIGPSAMVLARRLVSATSKCLVYSTTELAEDLGIGVPRLMLAFKRLERARLA